MQPFDEFAKKRFTEFGGGKLAQSPCPCAQAVGFQNPQTLSETGGSDADQQHTTA